MKTALLLLMLATFATGCSTTGRRVQWYEGQPVDTNKIARLKIQHDVFGVNVTVDKIDGVSLNKGKRFVTNNTKEIELLPGRHDFCVSYADSDGGHSVADAQIAFVAKAGEIYEMRAAPKERSFGTELRLNILGGQFTWSVWVLEAQTGKVIAGEPRLAPQHWYEK